jgi:hypothetical protein
MGNAIKTLPMLKKVPLESCRNPIVIPPGAFKWHSTGESEAFMYKTLKGEDIANYASPLITQ